MLYTSVKDTVDKLDVNQVSEERKEILQPLIEFIKDKKENNERILLNFICTHNSRRSHLAQIWAQVMAEYYHINNVDSYSGGTEATAMFPKVVETLIHQGLQINKASEATNPIYYINLGDNIKPVIGFSKIFEDDYNPKSNFAAIMTCSSADEGCPFVFGCSKRIAVTYEDPKAFDGTDLQTEKYIERSVQIATEMKYVFKSV